MALGVDGSIHIDTRIDSKGFNAGIKSMIGGLTRLAAAVGLAFGLGAVLNFGRSSVQAASELSAAMTGLQSVVTGTGKSFSEAQSFINDYIADGLVPATNAINAYKNLALRGYDTSQIEKVLIALKDSASFGRSASLTLGEAVQSATEGLKNENSILVDNAGVTKNVAKMWQDFASGIGTTADKLTKEQKILAEVEGIMEETKFQTGDAAKFANQYAGQVAALSASLQNLKVAVGNAIIPVISRVMPYVKAAVDQLTIWFNHLSEIMSILLGVDIGKGVAGLEEAADAQENLADATNDAQKAAKGALAAFDELSVLQTPEEGAATPPVVEEPETVVGDTGETDSALNELRARVEGWKEEMLKLLQPVTGAFGRLKDSLGGLGGTVWDGLNWAWENIMKPMGEWALENVVPAFLDLLAGAAETLNQVLIALQPLGTWLWESFLKPAGEWVGKKLLDALAWLKDRLYDLSDWIRTHQDTIRTIAVVLGIFALAWLLVTGAVALWTAIAGVATAVTTAFGAAVAFLASPIGVAILAVAALIAIIWFLISNWEDVKKVASQVWDWIVGIWKKAGDWFKTNVTDPLKNRFGDSWDNIKKAASGAWQGLQDTWTGVKEWFRTKVTDPLKEAFGSALDWVKEKWEQIFADIPSFVKNSINTVIDFINSMIRAIADGLNVIIGALNSISVTVPDWVPGFGGSTWGLNLPYVVAPQIPRLATGAVIPPNAEFLAMLGDQRSGRNIEAPEALLRQIVREELGRLEADIRIEFGGNLAALIRELKPHIDKENVRIGGSLIKGAVGI